MTRSRSYKVLSVNQLVPDNIVTHAMQLVASSVSIGIDVSKHDLFGVFRIGERHYSRPLKVLQQTEFGTRARPIVKTMLNAAMRGIE